MVNFTKLKQIRNLRKEAKKMQSSLKGVSEQGFGAGKKIVVSVDGNQKVEAVAIDQDLLNPSSQKELEKGIKNAVNDAMSKVQKIMQKKMKSGDIDFSKIGEIMGK